ncbi:MAG: sodium:solute symporter, partial [Planctomycetota bacterium]
EHQSTLFRWVAVLTGSKNALKGVGFFIGAALLEWIGFDGALWVMAGAIAVALVTTMGVRGFFVELRGGVVLLMAFLLAFMGRWNRRSGAMTRTEWMIFRFGDGFGGKFARVASALAELFFTVSAVAFFAKGLEVFLGPFLPMLEESGVSLAAAAVVFLVTIYTTAGGLVGVVWTDVFQGLLIFVAVAAVCFLAWQLPALPESFAVSVPLGGGEFAEVVQQRSAWESALPPLEQSLPGTYARYNAFGVLIAVFLLRATLDGCSGSGGYIVQRYLAARTEREAGLVGLAWTFLLSFRWPLVVAFALLGISVGLERGAPIADPEAVLPTVLAESVPRGLRGLLVACFLAAFMSTFSSVVNSAAAYWTNDLYAAYLRPKASERARVIQGRLASLVMVGLGLVFARSAEGINELWGWLTAALGGGLTIPLLLRWYWWRFNGEGFAIGTLFGMGAASAVLAVPALAELSEPQQFGFVALFSSAGCILGSFFFPQTEAGVLARFFRRTRPFGAWNPCRKELDAGERARLRAASWREVASALVAVPWQLALFLLPMTMMLRSWGQSAVLAGALLLLSLLLYKVWYRGLGGEEESA